MSSGEIQVLSGMRQRRGVLQRQDSYWLMFLAAEQGSRGCGGWLGSREGQDRRMHHQMVWLLILKHIVISTRIKPLEIRNEKCWDIGIERKEKSRANAVTTTLPRFNCNLGMNLGQCYLNLLFQHSWVHLLASGLSRFLWLISCTRNVGENRYG